MSDSDKTPASARHDPWRTSVSALTVTAIGLGFGLLVASMTHRTAIASGQNDRSGDYLMATMQLDGSTENVVVLDQPASHMVVYGYNVTNRTIDLLGDFNLNQLQEQRRPDSGKRGPRH